MKFSFKDFFCKKLDLKRYAEVDKVISKTTSVTFSVFILTFKMLFNILKVSRQCCFRKEVDFRCLHVIAACVQEDY